MLKQILEGNAFAEIKKYKWVGNHHSDYKMFHKVDNFVLDVYKTNPADAVKALRISSEDGMGSDTSKISDEQILKDFLDNQ